MKNLRLTILVLTVLALPSLTLANLAPSVYTQEPTTITAEAVIVEGKITNTGGDNSLSVWFQYGLTDKFGSKSQDKSFDGRGVFSIRITGLKSCTKYYYRAAAENSAGVGYGQTGDFKTYCPLADGAPAANGSPAATDVDTGIAADIFGSILWPLVLALILVWALKSPLLGFDKWANERKAKTNEFRAQKKLDKLSKR